jgi:hypothetical protein
MQSGGYSHLTLELELVYSRSFGMNRQQNYMGKGEGASVFNVGWMRVTLVYDESLPLRCFGAFHLGLWG